jgi:very-short-patch-repair endonuclease
MEPPTQTSVARARALRATMTPSEVRLWMALRKRALGGLRFRRQHPIGPFILDFYCHSARLAVEVDGVHHGLGDGPRYDERRDLWLERHGLTVVRVHASDVTGNLAGVLALIAEHARHATVVDPRRPVDADTGRL